MQNAAWIAVGLSLFAGSAVFIGAALASVERIRPKWLEQELRHTIAAVGGGALMAAVALVLVPEGMKNQPLWSSIATFLLGGALAMGVDRHLAKKQTTASQLVAMLMDFVPETIVIGAIITKDFKQAVFLAVIIFIQNLPESFTAYREITKSRTASQRRLLFWFGVIALTGPLYALIGASLLSNHDDLLAALMTIGAGGILYLVFNDVAPQAKLQRHWLPPMGALLGFVIGMIGHHIIGG